MTNFDVLKAISDRDRVDFSNAFSIKRPNYIGDTLFLDVKTQNLEAEYVRLAEGQYLPVAATVHGWDTEAKIGSRPVLEAVKIEQLLIKEKINQSEQLQRKLSVLRDDREAVRFVFDDAGLLFDRVKTRTEVAKMELLASGGFTITENNLSLAVDYGMPASHRLTFNWTGAANTYEPWTDMLQAFELAEEAGFPTGAIMLSRKDYNKIKSHPTTQAMVHSALGVGMLVTDAQMVALANEMMPGVTRFIINEEKYRTEKANGTFTTNRFFPENRLSFLPLSASGRVGTGLWGVTPEELRYQAFDNYTGRQFITLSQWSTPDPVAVWTKATGVFIPVAPQLAQGMILASTDNTTIPAPAVLPTP